MFKDKLPLIGRILSLVLLVVTIAVIVTAFIRARRQPRPPGPIRAEARLKANISSIVEGYKYVRTENGRETVRLLAARDIAYEDGRHELEKVDLTAFSETPGKSLRILSDRGSWMRDQNVVSFDGNVRVIGSDGLEVVTESLKYDQINEVASTDLAVEFRHADLSGSSTGAQLYAKTRNLALNKDVAIISRLHETETGAGLPIEVRSGKGEYAELDGVIRFSGNTTVTQGGKSARADAITGIFNIKTKKIERIEMRGNSVLKSSEQGRLSELFSKDMDFHFNLDQHLMSAIATGEARAISLEKDSPREIRANKIEAYYKPFDNVTRLQNVTAQGRSALKVEMPEDRSEGKDLSIRTIEADTLDAIFREDGKNLLRADAGGNAVLTVTPKQIDRSSDRKRVRAKNLTADFLDNGNLIKNFVATGDVQVEFEPLEKDSKRNKRTLTGKKMTADFSPQTQDISELKAEGGIRLTDGDRKATAEQATYIASNRIVSLRNKPLLWDSKSRANADEIDANIDTGESFLKGRVRTTYYSRESTGDSAPFKNKNGPVTIASDRAVVKHRESAARYTGNVRAWQDDDFVRAETVELDNGEKTMTAWGNAQSAFYDFERETSKGRKEIVPVFASSDRIDYDGKTKTVHYEGSVRIRQGTDRIDAAKADVIMDEEYKLVKLTGSGDIVLRQTGRRGFGDQIVYTVASDSVELVGNLAMVEDLDNRSITKSAKLTLHFRDARIEANDDSGSKKRVKTTHKVSN